MLRVIASWFHCTVAFRRNNDDGVGETTDFIRDTLKRASEDSVRAFCQAYSDFAYETRLRLISELNSAPVYAANHALAGNDAGERRIMRPHTDYVPVDDDDDADELRVILDRLRSNDVPSVVVRGPWMLSESIETGVDTPCTEETPTPARCMRCDENIGTVFTVPCGHRYACLQCTRAARASVQRTAACPYCRAHFTSLVRVFQ
jgi:hypothetical protein